VLFLASSCTEPEVPEVKEGNSNSVSSAPDPLASYMWHLNPVTVPYISGQVITSANSHINLSDLHNTYQGSGVTIVVSDEHAQLDHPDLKANADIAMSKNYVSIIGGKLVPKSVGPYFGNPYIPQLHSKTHGTNVAGTAAAAKNNGTGGFGVAPKAKVVNYNFLLSNQQASVQMDQLTYEGGNAVFNYSYGAYQNKISAYQMSFINELSHNAIYENNVYIKSSGNDYYNLVDFNKNNTLDAGEVWLGNSNFDQGNTFPQYIMVGATNAQGKRADYSSPGSNVWISAPGGDISATSNAGIMVTDIVGCDKGLAPQEKSTFPFDLGAMLGLNQDCSYFSNIQGTSFAAPVVSGVVALMKEANPKLGWREVKHILAETARPIDLTMSQPNHPLTGDLGILVNPSGHTYQQGWVTNGAWKKSKNEKYKFHPWYGFGLVDAKAAVEMAKTFDAEEIEEGKMTLDMDGDTYYSRLHSPGVPIPDYSAAGATSTIDVQHHNLEIEHVQIELSVTHPDPSQLGVELTSPSGTTLKLMNINSGITGTNLDKVVFGANGFYGERTKGIWTLKVIDGYLTDTGVLDDWHIKFLGNRGELLADQTPPENGTEIQFDTETSELSWTDSPSVDVARYEICVLDYATYEKENEDIEEVCMDGDWRTVIANSEPLEGHMEQGKYKFFQPGKTYVALLRTVDTSENESEEWDLTYWVQPE
jgi:subtilisin-like proprotein convertase family protein/subtilisin family serine protease